MAEKKKKSKAPLLPQAEGRKKGVLELAAEREREKSEATSAKYAQASIRDRMVKIGRGNQQAGRGRRGS